MFRTYLVVCVALLGLGTGLAVGAEEAAQDAAPPVADTAGPQPEEAAGPLPLSQALELVLLRSPYLESYAWDVRAADARALQARLRVNPVFSLQFDEVRWEDGPETHTSIRRLGDGAEIERRTQEGDASGFGEAEITVTLSQDIELGKKRAKRTRLSEQERDVAARDYQVAKAAVLAETAKDFAQVLAQQAQLELAGERVAHAEEVVEKLERSRLPVTARNKATTGLTEAMIEQSRVRRDLDTARLRLASHWGSTAPRFERADGQLGALPPLPSQAVVLERIEENPEIGRWAAELEAREAALAVERAQAVPDLETRIGFRSDRLRSRDTRGFSLRPDRFELEERHRSYARSRDNTLLFEFSIPLPVFDRNQGAIEEARHLLAKADAESRAVAVRVRTEALSLWTVLEAARTEVDAIETEIIPKHTETLATIQKGVQMGGFTHFDLADARRDLDAARQDRIEALLAYHEAAADLQRLIGCPPAAAGNALSNQER